MLGLPHNMMRSVSRLSAGKIGIGEQPVGGDQIGDAAAIAERLARDGRIVDELLGQHRPEELVLREAGDELFAVGELGDLPAAVHEHDLLEAVVDVRILDQARERRKARSGRQQQQAGAGQQIVGDQRAGRLAADQNGIAFADLLQA